MEKEKHLAITPVCIERENLYAAFAYVTEFNGRIHGIEDVPESEWMCFIYVSFSFTGDYVGIGRQNF